MRKKPWLILGLILLFGLLIRVYKIQSLPLYGDELTMVYDTYSIYKTGMDSTGQKFPLTFKMGAGRPGGYIYFSVPFVAMFGPTVWGERTLSLISGLGIIVLMYFLGKKLFDQRVGTLAALLTAISPWDIYLSRGGFEAHFALFLALLGVTAFVNKKYILWAISWGLTMFTYPTFKLTLPIFFVVLVALGGVRKIIKNKSFWASLLILLVFGFGLVYQTFRAGSENRFMNLNMFSDNTIRQDIIQNVNYERTVSTLPEILKPIFINKQIEYGRKFIDSYIANLSPNFLILRGDGNPRNNPGEMGMIYFIELPLIIISLFLLWTDNRKLFKLLSCWILIVPIATAIMEGPHALRNDLMLPALILLSAFTISKLSKKQSLGVFLVIAIQFTYILIRIYTVAPAKFASFWSASAKSESLIAIAKAKNGEKVVLNVTKTDNIEYAYEVNAKLDPKEVIAQYGKFPKVYGNVTITDK